MIKKDNMGNLIDKTLKQISTNIIPQGNVPTIPEQFQTGAYYPSGGIAEKGGNSLGIREGNIPGQMQTAPVPQVGKDDLEINDSIASSTYVDKKNLPNDFGMNIELNKKIAADIKNKNIIDAQNAAEQKEKDKITSAIYASGGSTPPDFHKLSAKEMSSAYLNRQYILPKND